MPQLIIEVIGDASSLNRTFRQVERQTRTFGQRMKRVAGIGVFAGATAGVAGFTAALKSGFSELAESQKVAAQTAAALKSTGRTAGVTAGEIDRLARSIQRYSGADDEAVQAAENLLLTFTNIRNQGSDRIFDDTTRAVVDLSQAFDQDLSTSAIQLGKALNDPERGLTALRRIGIGFTDAQVKLITRLNETGRTLEAQKLILQEVNRQVGGSARAFGETLPGKLKIAQGNIQNVTGAIAEQLSPQIEKLLDRFNRWIENEENVNRLTETSATLFRDAASAAETLADAIGFLAGKYTELRGAAEDTNSWFERHGLGFLNEGAVDWGIWDRFQIRAPWNALPGRGGPGRTTVGRAASPDTLDPRGPGRTRVATMPRYAGDLTTDRETDRKGDRDAATKAAIRSNTWFDAMIGRMLGRVGDAPTIRGQISRLQEIARLLQKRLAATKDVTRRLNLEDQFLDVQAQIRGLRGDQRRQAAAAREAAADKRKAALEEAVAGLDLPELGVPGGPLTVGQVNAAMAKRQRAAFDRRLGWLELAADRAAASESTSRQLKTARRIEKAIKDQIAVEGRTLELTRKLWEQRDKIKELNKRKTDPLAGLTQVSSKRMAALLGAGLGLDAAQRRVLQANVAGQEIHNYVHLDGREVSRSVNRANASSAYRTARQTSGYRG